MYILRISSLPNILQIGHLKKKTPTHAEWAITQERTGHQMFLFHQEIFQATHKVVHFYKNVNNTGPISLTKNKIIVLWSIKCSHQLNKILHYWSSNIHQVHSKFCNCQGSENSQTDDLQSYFKILFLSFTRQKETIFKKSICIRNTFAKEVMHMIQYATIT